MNDAFERSQGAYTPSSSPLQPSTEASRQTRLAIGIRKSVFNATMRDERKRRGWTLHHLGLLTGISSVSLGTYERLLSVPPLDRAQEIADALELALQDIFPSILRALPRARPQEMRLSAEEAFEAIEERVLLKAPIGEALATLTRRERRVIEERFGLNGEAPKTLEVIGRSFGHTRERIRQIEAKALRKLRHPSRSQFFAGLIGLPYRDHVADNA